MGFLTPWFLAGAAAIGLPIYLHLLRRHTTTPRRFSSLMFFRPHTQSSVRHRRLHYLLLLAFRVAVLLLLALAFAGPFVLRPAASAASTKRTLLVIDRSFSMRAGTRLTDAKRAALATLASLGPADHVQVEALGAHVAELTQPTDDISLDRSTIGTISAGDERGSYSELARSVRLLADTFHGPIVVHLFSDLQRSDMPGNFADAVLPPNARLVLHPAANAAEPNWTVESVSAPHQIFGTPAAGANPVQAVIAGSNTPAASRTVGLVLNGKTVATQQVAVPANGRATVTFPSIDVPYGFTRGEVRLDAADTLAADDVDRFAVERSDPQRVLFVHRATDTRSPFYFSAALESALGGAFVLQPVTIEQLGDLPLTGYAFVVLSDIPSVPPSFHAALDRFVRDGGGALIALGPSVAGLNRIPFAGDRIDGVRNYSRQGAAGHEPFLEVGRLDTSDARAGTGALWAGVKFYYAVALQPGTARVAVRLTDDTPLLLEESHGEGRVVVFTSTLDNVANDFPLHAAFVPFVAETARYLAAAEQQAGSRIVDALMTLRSAERRAGASTAVEVVDPEGRHPLSLQQAATADSFRMTEAGFYQFRLADGRQDVVGVNPDRRESDLTPIPRETLALWQGGAIGPTASGRATTGSPAGPEKVREPLWRYVMLLVLLAALAESFLAGRYLGTAREEDATAPEIREAL